MNEKYRISIITKKGHAISKNCSSQEDCIEFYCKIDNKEGIKMYVIKDRETGEILERKVR